MKEPFINQELQKYIPIIDFFSHLLGENAEIVLHDIATKNLDASVVYIKNGLTGRKVGSPATDFLLNILKSESYKENDYRLNYRSKNYDGREFTSSSLFIKNDNQELIGMLCVNIDQTYIDQVGHKMEDALEWFSKFTNFKPKCEEQDSEKIDETLFGSVGNMIEQAIFSVTGSTYFEPRNVTKNQKLAIVRYLYEREYFAYKNAVLDLAVVFNMSEVSIYKYIQTVKKEINKEDY